MSSEICSRVDTKLRDQGQPLREQSKCAAFSLSRSSHQGSPEALDHTAKKFDRFSCPTPVSYSSPFSWNWTETGGWEVVTSGLAVWLLTSSFFRLPGALTAPVQPLRNGRPPDISSLTIAQVVDNRKCGEIILGSHGSRFPIGGLPAIFLDRAALS